MALVISKFETAIVESHVDSARTALTKSQATLHSCRGLVNDVYVFFLFISVVFALPANFSGSSHFTFKSPPDENQ
jgi:hypothetical protein